MKKLILILAISAVSCQKKTCWKCTIATNYTGSQNVPPGAVRTENVCDKTKSEIREYEKSASSSIQSGSLSVRTSASCVEGN